MKKKLLVLGGIALAKQIVEQAHKMGVEVCVTDYLENSPSKEIADKSFMVSTMDVGAVVELIKEEKIDGVLTGYIDSLLPSYVQICKAANLPCYATERQISITTDKYLFKETCRKFQVPVVPEYTMSDVLSGRVVFPLLVKPVDNSGARGIYICHDVNEFRNNYKSSLTFSPSGHVLIERYMSGLEVTIFYFLHQGEVYLMGMGDRHLLKFDEGLIPLPVGYTFPSVFLDKYRQKIHPRVVSMFKSLGMQEGMIFIQSFVENGKCVIYEMGYRLTGSLEHHIINKVCGFNPLEAIINYALGNEIDDKAIQKISPDKGFAANVTLLLQEGEIACYEGIEQVESMNGILHVFVSYKKGHVIDKKIMGTLAQVGIRVLLVAGSKKELINRMKKIKDVIKVINTQGENMLLEDYSYELILSNYE